MTFHVAVSNVSALRLEVLADDSLPARGPGRNATGNFLLNHIEVTVNGKAVKVARVTATFTETNYSVNATIEEMSKPKKGWSVDGTTNKHQSAVFEFAERLPAGDVKVKLVQQYGKKTNYRALQNFWNDYGNAGDCCAGKARSGFGYQR